MRGSFWRALLAAGLTTTIGLATGAPPAQAWDGTCPGCGPKVTVTVRAAVRWYFAAGEAVDPALVLTEAVAALAGFENEVVANMNRLALSDVYGHIDALYPPFADYKANRTTRNIGSMARDARTFAAADAAKFRAVEDPALKDQVAAVVIQEYPMAITSAKDAGYGQVTVEAIDAQYRTFLDDAIRELEPICRSSLNPPGTSPVYTEVKTCTAADGHSESAFRTQDDPPFDENTAKALKERAAANSAWLTAVRTRDNISN